MCGHTSSSVKSARRSTWRTGVTTKLARACASSQQRMSAVLRRSDAAATAFVVSHEMQTGAAARCGCGCGCGWAGEQCRQTFGIQVSHIAAGTGKTDVVLPAVAAVTQHAPGKCLSAGRAAPYRISTANAKLEGSVRSIFASSVFASALV